MTSRRRAKEEHTLLRNSIGYGHRVSVSRHHVIQSSRALCSTALSKNFGPRFSYSTAPRARAVLTRPTRVFGGTHHSAAALAHHGSIVLFHSVRSSARHCSRTLSKAWASFSTGYARLPRFFEGPLRAVEEARLRRA